MRRQSERGSAIIMLFIAVALFGMLAFAFMQGSRTSTGWLESERGKASETGSQDCTNSLSMAIKRLEARGCGALISLEIDGSNPNPDAPTNGSCSVYHANGGGAKYCGTAVAAPEPPCGTSPAIGDVCGDGTIYAGISPDGNDPMYITSAAHEISTTFGPTGSNSGITHCTAAEASCSTGQANTSALATNPANIAAIYCENSTAHGHSDWYLPSRAEYDVLSILYQNGFGSLQGTWYYTSSQSTDDHAWLVAMPDANHFMLGAKWNTDFIRCARKIP